MVVCIFFNIEFVKVIIGLVVLEVGGNKLSAVDRDKVSSTVYCINVNYRDVGGIVGLVGRLDHPHPSVFIRQVSNGIEPMHNCTWIQCSFVTERKKVST
jgi:hypothetical protein